MTGLIKVPEKTQAILDKYDGFTNKQKLVFPNLSALFDLENSLKYKEKLRLSFAK